MVACASSVNLFSRTNGGALISLKLPYKDGQYKVKQTHVTKSSGPQAVWLELDKPHDVFYCLDRPGSVNTVNVAQDGRLAPIASQNTTIGPVSSTFYNIGENRGMVAAHL